METQRIVIKLGGGLISNKQQLCTPELEALSQLASVISRLQASGYAIVLVHGAGSFGHIRAKKWRLAEGLLDVNHFKDIKDDCQSQMEAVERVREDMLRLNRIVLQALKRFGVATEPFPPHLYFQGTGPEFTGDISMLIRSSSMPIPVTFGDVVEVNSERKFGILSGDDLVVRLAVELPAVKRLVFAVKGVDGILRKPPSIASEQDLIEVYRQRNNAFVADTNPVFDVTGGIGYKVSRALLVAQKGIEVLLVNGNIPERVHAACEGREVRCTKVVA